MLNEPISIKDFNNFERIVKANFHPRFASAKNPNPSSFGAVAQIGGSGIQLGLTGYKPDNEITRFKLDFKKFDPIKHTEAMKAQIAKKNTTALQSLFQIINFVSDQAKLVGQKTLEVVFAVAGFNTQNPPKAINPAMLAESKPAHPGKYFTTNILWENPTNQKGTSSSTSNSVNFLREREAASRTTNFKYRDEGTKASRIYKDSDSSQNFVVMNDTCAVAASKITGLQQGDNALGIVCGSGFNIGIARGFDGNNGFKELENTESGHNKFDKDELALFVSLLDSPLVKENGERTTIGERSLYARKHLTPELIFSGSPKSGEGSARGIKKQLLNLQEFAKLNQQIRLKNATSIQKQLIKVIDQALPKLKDINLEEMSDERLQNYTETFKNDKDLQALVEGLYKDYFRRLGNFIGSKIKNIFDAEGIKNLKAINITGSFLVNALKNKFAHLFYRSLANQLEISSIDENVIRDRVNLFEREQMDGLVDLIKVKAAQSRLGTASARPTAAQTAAV